MKINSINTSSRIFFKKQKNKNRNINSNTNIKSAAARKPNNCNEQLFREFVNLTKNCPQRIVPLQNGDITLQAQKTYRNPCGNTQYDFTLTQDGEFFKQRTETIKDSENCTSITHYNGSNSSFIVYSKFLPEEYTYVTQEIFEIVNNPNDNAAYIIHTKINPQENFWDIEKYDLNQLDENLDVIKLIREGKLKPSSYVAKKSDKKHPKNSQEKYLCNSTEFSQKNIEDEHSSKRIYKIKDENKNSLLNLIRTHSLYGDISYTRVNRANYSAFFDKPKFTIEIFKSDSEEPLELDLSNIGTKASSEALWELFKKCPADMLSDLAFVKKIFYTDNVFECMSNIDECYIKTTNEPTVFAHELGHIVDHKKGISSDPELFKICNEEQKQLRRTIPEPARKEFDYLSILEPKNEYDSYGLQELVADTYVLLHGFNYNKIEPYRMQVLKQYFPRTIAKIAQLLND